MAKQTFLGRATLRTKASAIQILNWSSDRYSKSMLLSDH